MSHEHTEPPIEFPFEVHLRAIRRSLWCGRSPGGASVLVGAGFSRNAEPLTSGAPPFSLWSDLLGTFENALGYSEPSGRGTSDALRLASEYQEEFGVDRLGDLLRRAIPDDQYRPGQIHQLLLELPWADIFTTNYDTLLERSRGLAGKARYSLVQTVEDIPGSVRPRIVKLHGSFPAHRPFIITEEDYRTYPHRFAPFVNAVQQAAMETTLCLVGFSGDDPNFLQWTGWVQDNLRSHAPKIYLIGVLDLAQARASLLRARRVVPVDLAPIVPKHLVRDAAMRQQMATKYLLDYLQGGEPSEPRNWPFSRPLAVPRPPLAIESEVALTKRNLGASAIPDVLQRIRRARLSYPGWAVTPETVRQNLRTDADAHSLFNDLDSLCDWIVRQPGPEALSRANDLAWFFFALLLPPPPSVLRICDQILDGVPQFDNKSESVSAPIQWAWFELAMFRLSESRNLESPLLYRRAAERGDRYSKVHSAWRAHWLLEHGRHALLALDELSFAAALHELEGLSLTAFQSIQLAGLMLYADRHDDAFRLAKMALSDISSSVDRTNMLQLSEEGWALSRLISMNVNTQQHFKRLTHLQRDLCDPLQDLRARESAVLKNARESNETILSPAFDHGQVTTTTRLSRYEWSAEVLIRTLDRTMHPAWHIENDAMEAAISVLAEDNLRAAIAWAIAARSIKGVKRILSRSAVAQMDESNVGELTDWLLPIAKRALSARDRNSPFRHAYPVIFELISRLSIRITEAARESLVATIHEELVRGMSPEINDNFEVVRTLFSRLIDGMSAEASARCTVRLINFPVHPKSSDGYLDMFWPDPFRSLHLRSIDRIENDPLASGIAILLREFAEDDPKYYPRYLQRLITILGSNSMLSLEEDKLFDTLNALFDRSIDFYPAIANALLHMGRRLNGASLEKIRGKFLSRGPRNIIHDDAIDLNNAHQAEEWFRYFLLDHGYISTSTGSTHSAAMSQSQMIEFIRIVAEWSLENVVVFRKYKSFSRLQRSVISALSVATLRTNDEASGTAVRGMVETVAGNSWLTLPARIALAIRHSEGTADLEREVRLALLSDDPEVVFVAAEALNLWLWSTEQHPPPNVLGLCDDFVAAAAFKPVGLARLQLWSVLGRMLKRGHVSASARRILTASLEQIANDTTSLAHADGDWSAMMRASAALVAAALSASQSLNEVEVQLVDRWRQIASTDALPEVRRSWKHPEEI